jgi:hypothetical protein
MTRTDEARPICQKCRNGFFICRGYEQPFIFQNQGLGSGLPSRSVSETLQAAGSVTDSRMPSAALGANRYYLSLSSLPSHSDAEQLRLTTPSSHGLAASQVQMVTSHLINKIFLQWPDVPSPNLDKLSWIKQIAEEPDRTSPSYLSLLALAVGFFAQVRKDRALQKEGARLYGLALRKLSKTLANESAFLTYYPALTTAFCLLIYEFVMPSDTHAWMRHTSGIAAMVRKSQLLIFTPDSYAKRY